MTETLDVDQLRKRVAELEAELSTARAKAETPAHPAWRSVTAAVLIILSCILAPLSVAAVWVNNQVSDTARYVDTVAPLADSPAIQKAIADEVTETVFEYVNVEAITSDALAALSSRGLSPQAAAGVQALKAPLVNGVESFTRSQVTRIVESPAFAKVWVQANEVAHAQLVALLSGEGDRGLSAQDGAVTLNLAPIIARVKAELVAEGYTVAQRIPEVNRSFVLVRSDKITKAQGLYRLLDKLGLWLPILTLVFFALGLFAATARRSALIRGSVGIAGGMLALGVAIAVARPLYLNAVPADVLPTDAAADAFDVIVRYLRLGLRTVAALALVVALGAFLTGPSESAVALRSKLSQGIGSLRTSAASAGLSTGPVGIWIFRHKRALRVVVVLAGAFTLTMWERPTGLIVLGTAAAVVIVLGLVELLGQPPSRHADVVPGQQPAT